jgi:RNA polymerase sigma-70 factor (family 1)
MESTLLTGIQNGYASAFNELYNVYFDRLYFFARRYVEEADAQDIVADTFLQFWPKRADFEHFGAIVQFLFITCRNRCLNVVKHQQVKLHHASELLTNDPQVVDPYFIENQIRVELTELLYDQLRQLPEKMREIFLLSFEESLKPAQIAERLGITVKTVTNQKASAIRILKDVLRNHPLEVILLVLLTLEKNLPSA